MKPVIKKHYPYLCAGQKVVDVVIRHRQLVDLILQLGVDRNELLICRLELLF